jgi:uncharacterized protein (TIGR03000 family)
MTRRILFAAALTFSAVPFLRAQAPPKEGQSAILIVRIYPDASLTVDGTATKQKGETRRFSSPPLEPGKSYHYTLVAEWMPGNNYETYTVTRKVKVEAGKEIQVDLRKADPAQGDKLFIRYVPTPEQVVDAMMKLAGVGKDDVVYDLGCGDGRMLIAAVKKFKARRGVGIDLDPERIEEAKAAAKEAGVADKVEVRKGDVLKVEDLSDATVVTLYLSDDLNLLLRPILLKQLKPGTRIVAHRFLMGDWKPDKSETVTIAEGAWAGEYRIHLWTVPKK